MTNKPRFNYKFLLRLAVTFILLFILYRNFQPKSEVFYRMKKGDTISSVARGLEITPEELLELNGSVDIARLHEGDRILVPGRSKATWDVIYHKLKNIDPLWMISAFAVFLASLLLSALQWMFLLRIQGIRISWSRVFVFYMIGQFFNNFLPSNWGGDVVRMIDISQYNGEWEKGTASIIMDRVLGLYALTVLGFLAALIFFRKIIGLIPLILISAALAVIPALFLVLDLSVMADKLEKYRPAKGIRKFMIQFLRALGIYRQEKMMGSVLGIALITQFFRILMNTCVSFSLGFFLSVRSFFIIVPVIGLASALPVSVNGVGLREMAGDWISQMVLPVYDQSLIIMFTMGYLVITATSLLGGLFFIIKQIRKGRRETA